MHGESICMHEANPHSYVPSPSPVVVVLENGVNCTVNRRFWGRFCQNAPKPGGVSGHSPPVNRTKQTMRVVNSSFFHTKIPIPSQSQGTLLNVPSDIRHWLMRYLFFPFSFRRIIPLPPSRIPHSSMAESCLPWRQHLL